MLQNSVRAGHEKLGSCDLSLLLSGQCVEDAFRPKQGDVWIRPPAPQTATHLLLALLPEEQVLPHRRLESGAGYAAWDTHPVTVTASGSVTPASLRGMTVVSPPTG